MISLGSSPRVRGTHFIHKPDDFFSRSSPRVRGTRCVAHAHACPGRFIPACAGNTPDSDIDLQPISVHPRVCGEHDIDNLEDESIAGSSPRVRGTRSDRYSIRVGRRFIPRVRGTLFSEETDKQRLPECQRMYQLSCCVFEEVRHLKVAGRPARI